MCRLLKNQVKESENEKKNKERRDGPSMGFSVYNGC